MGHAGGKIIQTVEKINVAFYHVSHGTQQFLYARSGTHFRHIAHFMLLPGRSFLIH